MTIITISTVGFSEIVPLTKVGRSITVVIIILGISVGTYTVGIIVQWLVGGELQKIFGRRKLQKQIADLRNQRIDAVANQRFIDIPITSGSLPPKL